MSRRLWMGWGGTARGRGGRSQKWEEEHSGGRWNVGAGAVVGVLGYLGRQLSSGGGVRRDNAVFGMGVEEGPAQGWKGGLKTQRLREAGGEAVGQQNRPNPLPLPAALGPVPAQGWSSSAK